MSTNRRTETIESRSLVPVYDESGNVTETHEHKGDFKEP
jgi:hypothetical protein